MSVLSEAERIARTQGSDAYCKQICVTENPYDPFKRPYEWRAWMDGYHEIIDAERMCDEMDRKPGLSQQLRLTLGVMLIGIAVVITVVVKGVWSI